MVATAYVVSYRNIYFILFIGCEDRLRNDLLCIKWNVNFYLTQFVKYLDHLQVHDLIQCPVKH